MTHRKKLIEVALPLEAINVASAREKSIRHGHPSTLHLWWARRPLAAARAVIFASLVDDPDSPDALPAFVAACQQLPASKNVAANGDTPRMRLFDFIERLVTWEATTDEAILNTARELIQIATEGNPPPLLDPFAGGGSIPLEAQRLGLEAHASDLNPVAVMINKAQIEIPPRFANLPPVNPRDRKTADSQTGTAGAAQWRGAAGLAADVRYYGEWMRAKAWEKIGHLYPTHNGETVIAWIWARTVKSPNPAVNAPVPLVRSFILSKKKGKECWAQPIIEGNTVRFEVTQGTPAKGQEGTTGKQYGGGKCIISGVPMSWDYIRDEGQSGRMGVMLMAIVTEGKNGRNYYSPTDEQTQVAKSALPDWQPDYQLPVNPRDFKTPLYGLKTFADLFTPRQLVALTTFSDLVAEARKQAQRDALAAGMSADDIPLQEDGRGARAYAEAVSVYLAFAVDRSADFWSSLAVWANQPKNELVAHVFGRQALPMVWDFAEANSFSDSGGNWLGNLNYLIKAIDANPKISLVGAAIQQDASKIELLKTIMISTDPPYYDMVGYADLSDYFYVWMRRALQDVYPDIFGTMLVPKALELIASPYRHGSKETANAHFEGGMLQTFSNIRRFVSIEYPLTVYYAFKQQDAESEDEEDHDEGRGIMHPAPTGRSTVASTGWETMLTSLIDSGFSIDGTWPIRSERTIGLKGSINALASSIVLVCRPRPQAAPTTSRRAFVDALRRELPAALKEMQSGNIAPVDLAQASIGPGMAIYSRYSQVLEADGSPLSVRTALGLINQALDEYLAEQDGDIDGDTRFAVAWFEQFGFNDGEFGQADVLARAKNTSVAGVENAGLVVAGRGKVRLLHWKEYDPSAIAPLTLPRVDTAAHPSPTAARGEGLETPLAPQSVGEGPGVRGKTWNPRTDKRLTIWEATHHLIERLNTHGETGTAMLMTQLPSEMAAEARNLAYRLYSICERKNWADHARDYNALVISWAGIGEETARLRQQAASGDATQQKRLFE
jgi:putative DNA methylase